MLLGIIASVGANLLGAMFSTPRLTYRMALEGHLPSLLGRVHPRFHTPAVSIIFYGAASFAFAVSGGFVWLAGLSVLARLVLYFICVAAMPRLRRKFGKAPDAMQLPAGPFWMVLSLLVCVVLLLQVKLESVLVTIACVIAGSFLLLRQGHTRQWRRHGRLTFSLVATFGRRRNRTMTRKPPTRPAVFECNSSAHSDLTGRPVKGSTIGVLKRSQAESAAVSRSSWRSCRRDKQTRATMAPIRAQNMSDWVSQTSPWVPRKSSAP